MAAKSVRNRPGAMQFTVIEHGPRSSAVARAMPMRAVLVAEYPFRPLIDTNPIEEM